MFKSLRYLKIHFLFCAMIFVWSANAQQFQPEINAYLQQAKTQWKLTDADIASYVVSDQYTNAQTGITHAYLQQQVNGIRIFNAVSTMAIRSGAVVHFANRFIADAAAKITSSQPVIDQQHAIVAAATQLDLTMKETPRLLNAEENRLRTTWTRGGIAQKDIKVELFYVLVDNTLQLAWNVSLAPVGSADWWNIRIDALSGQYLEKNNWTTHCTFEGAHRHPVSCNKIYAAAVPAPAGEKKLQAGNYRAYPLPVEAPLYGDRSLLPDPSNAEASPYGWHDDNGVEGAEYTITRGNNVHVYEDIPNTNEPGHSPDGGVALNFDFPIDLNLPPVSNQDAALTNLFYLTNRVHDILYVHGFDEPSGNFQAFNYNGEGLGNDYVLAEGQDGGGNSNANFATPEDGENGRMQMYIWQARIPAVAKVLSPAGIAGEYVAAQGTLGGALATPITAQAVLVNDETGLPTDGCSGIQNAAAVAGKIAIIDRGGCAFFLKMINAQNAGAVALLVCNSSAGDPLPMNGPSTFDIPAVMISKADGELIKAQLANGTAIEMTIQNSGPAIAPDRDGALDNGIIAHEYGHGLSRRLTGGPSNANCLSNLEQGGEGWSDWLGLILTIESDDRGTEGRSLNAYALNDASGYGVRRYLYSTDRAINPQTYGDLAASVTPHEIGEIWNAALWDMTWNLIDAEGFDPDWDHGNGGNNTAMRLVIEALKLQPCTPGYIDARDALLAADELLYQNAHHCLIWEAFARRGMGVHALQGSVTVVGDETEDFSVPETCPAINLGPIAAFTVDAPTDCSGNFEFTDLSTDGPEEWLWNFGDGLTSVQQNPSHSYTTPGTYTVTLTVSNAMGSDSATLEVVYGPSPAPAVSGNTTVCEGGAALLTAEVADGNTATWSLGGNVVHTGTSFLTPEIDAPVTYTVQEVANNPVQHVGPPTNNFGTGGNHNSGFDGKLLFQTFKPLKLVSVLVYAEGAGERTIRLLDGGSEELQSVTTFVPAGASRVTLNFNIPNPNNYILANLSQNLYRNNTGASYPYAIADLISINSSNSPDAELTFYYYFYDWEVQEAGCVSEPATVALEVAPGPVAAFTTANDNMTINFTDASTGTPSSWQWNFGDGSAGSTAQNPAHTYPEEGVYVVELTVSGGDCASTYRQEIEVGTTGANEPAAFSGLKIYPNPAGEVVQLEFRQALPTQAQLFVTDAAGRLVWTQPLKAGILKTSVSTHALPAGVYQFRVVGEGGALTRQVIVLKK